MAYADYLHCPGCEGKTIYWPDDDEPEGVAVWHQSCLDAEIAKRAAAQRERIRQLAIKHQARYRTCDGTHPASGDCKAWTHRAPFADLLGEEAP